MINELITRNRPRDKGGPKTSSEELEFSVSLRREGRRTAGQEGAGKGKEFEVSEPTERKEVSLAESFAEHTVQMELGMPWRG